MKKKIGSIILGSLMVISLVIASCGPTEVEEEIEEEEEKVVEEKEKVVEKEKEEVKPLPGEGNWWDKFGEPQYGGTFTLRLSSGGRGGDPYFGYSAPGSPGRMYLQVLAYPDWTIDREAYPPMTFGNRGIPGAVLYETLKGELAESWETPDTTTIIFHIRKGIHWQNIPPVNGRELTADDIVYHWQRLLGLGSGYTKPSPYASVTFYSATASITATDKYTVVWKLSYPTLGCLETLLDARAVGQVVPREVIEKYGDAQDFKNAVGTGPFILEDYVSETFFNFSKNLNYWGYDERHPENKIPYVDSVKALIIPDNSTAYAALRTGKLDIIEGIDWRQADSLMKTNPQLQGVKLPSNAQTVNTRVDKPPFTDIRVRKALQMAIDLESIAKTYYGGHIDGTPCGLYHPMYSEEYATPYDKWPDEIKAEYAYNPEGAKKLLAEAGYPQGFKTNCVATSNSDLDLLQIVKSYFAEIGVDMEITTLESVAFTAFVNAGKTEQMNYWVGVAGMPFPPLVPLDMLYSQNVLNKSKSCINDPIMDEICMKAKSSMDPTERAKLCKEGSDYYLTQHWHVNLLPTISYNVYQPWFKGYSGENIGEYGSGFYFARCWVDHEIKKNMGY